MGHTGLNTGNDSDEFTAFAVGSGPTRCCCCMCAQCIPSHTYVSSAERARCRPCPPCADTALTCGTLSLFLQHFFTHLDPHMRDYCWRWLLTLRCLLGNDKLAYAT